MQLPETFDLRHGQIVAAQVEPGVKEHAAVPGRENEIIAADPTRLIGVMFKRVTVKHRAHLRATERKSEMSGLRSLHCVHAKPASFVGCARKAVDVQTHKQNGKFMISDFRFKATNFIPRKRDHSSKLAGSSQICNLNSTVWNSNEHVVASSHCRAARGSSGKIARDNSKTDSARADASQRTFFATTSPALAFHGIGQSSCFRGDRDSFRRSGFSRSC